ncbi:hypothetical protein ACH5RR_022952 [Cinchona calisaya]|uniref:Ty3 transposon capsid-like protein domain-containing protein n=1 Tax=Cinchona calisaya TaxID=153742 RepID=A0ABD2Z996_9GENT
MSMQLKEITSDKKSLLNNGKNVAADSSSTQAVADRVIEFEEDIVKEFHNLKQTDTVKEYQDKFEKFRDLLMKINYGLTENYFISSFLSGLKAEIRLLVRKPKPETLYHAFNLARIQEIAIQVEKEKLIYSIRRNMGESTWPSNCIEVYVNHDYPQKMQCLVGGRVLSTIISTGVAFTFIDTKAAIQAACKIEEAEPLLLTFVFGCYQAVSKFECRGFKWTIQGHEFVTDVRIVELRACDMVIGRKWLYDYRAEVQLCFNRVIVFKEGKKVVLQIEEDQLSCAEDKQEK